MQIRSRFRAVTLLAAFAIGVSAAAASDHEAYRVEHVSFYSDVLDGYTEMNVAFPPGYEEATEPYPVLYFMHGGLTDEHTYAPGFVEAAKLAGVDDYLVVFPDECRLCNYTNGLTVGEAHVSIDDQGNLQPVSVDSPGVHVGTPWERYFLEDLMPYVESTYNVRTDRGGRGMTGHSQGGVGTGIWITKYPDLFGFAWAMSGALNMNPYADNGDAGVYARVLVYGDPVTHEWRWMDNDPYVLATNLVGLGVDSTELGLSVGDGRCSDDPEAPPGRAGGCTNEYENERVRRERTIEFSGRLDDLGIPHTVFLYGPASHREIAPAMIEMVGAARDAFGKGVGERPQRFQYKTMARTFRAWGYDVEVERPNHEFLYLEGVGADSLTVRGTGRVTMVTPPLYAPAVEHRVTLTNADGATDLDVWSDDEGRLRLSFVAGETRLFDQRYASESEGDPSEFPATTIEIDEP